MNLYIPHKKESKKSYVLLFIIILIGIHFFGLQPVANYVNSPSKPAILIRCIIFLFFALKINKEQNEYTRTLLYLWLSLGLNKISSFIFNQQPFSSSLFQGFFVYDLGFFYIISYIKPSIKQIEKIILYLGVIGLGIYYIQYMLLPKPLVESLTSGWRAINEVSEFDIKRFTLTGEVLIFLCGLLCLNKYLHHKKKIFIIIYILVFSMCFLHGYRSLIISFIVSSCFIFYKIHGFRFNGTAVGFLIVIICLTFLIKNTSLFNEVLETFEEKNLAQSSESIFELDRIIEFKYFYDNIKSPIEWFFGAGFIGKNLTGIDSFINWVDLGFIGLSFMGGILITFFWLRLLFMNIRKVKSKEYVYIRAFSLFILLSTIALPIAFIDKSPIIQSLAFYLFFQIKKSENRKLSC